jgi:uncharacterized membrane protein
MNVRLFILSVFAGASVMGGASLQAMAMLRFVGVEDVFQSLSISGGDKINFALFLTLSLSSLIITLWAGSNILRRRTRIGGLLAFLGLISGFCSLMLPPILGYPFSVYGALLMLVGLTLTGLLGYLGLKTPGAELKTRLLTPVDIAFVAVFSALTAVITGSTGMVLPSPTGGYTNVGDTVIFIAALLLGSKVGGLVGVIGPVVADLFVGYPRWFVTVLAHGSEGFIAGLGKGKNILVQITLLLISGFAMATTYFVVNVFTKGYPLAVISYVRDLFGQALVSIILGLVLTKAVEKALPNLIKK